MLPVRVVVVNSLGDMGAPSEPIADSYAIVTDSLKLCDIVAFALTPLGLGHLATESKGFIQFENWKPIPLEDITNNKDILVVDLLKPVAHSAVLKVVVNPVRISPCSSPEVISAPLDLSRAKVQHETTEALLTDAECIKIDSGSEHGSDGCSKQLLLRNEREPEDGVSALPESVVNQPPSVDHILLQFLQQQAPLFELPLNFNASETQEQFLAETHSGVKHQPKMTRSRVPTKKRLDPTVKPEKPSLVRFDPVTEVPMLQDWFVENRIPSKAQCQSFADTLNSMSYRQANPPLSSTTVYNWFKYTRSRGPKSAACPVLLPLTCLRGAPVRSG